MKRVLPLLTLAASLHAAEPINGLVTLRWDGDASWTNGESLRLYHSPDIARPMTNWIVLTNMPATNLTVSLTVIPGHNFFAATVSNFWGESDFSNVASTPALPRGGDNLSVRKGAK